MTKNKKVLIAKITCILGVFPVLIYAYSSGPDTGYTGAPGDNATACISAGCHAGTTNKFSGNVQIVPANGNTYLPGQTQLITVKITDSTQKSWGFQLTARLASNLKTGQAGGFDNIDANSQTSPTLILCGPGGPAIVSATKGQGKACSTDLPIQYAEHSSAGNRKSLGNVGTYSYQVNWTAPPAGSGPVMLYVAANASDGSDNPAVGHIYTNNIQLTEAAASTGAKPSITSSGGVVNGATLASGIAPNTYITIFGSNLATTSRGWAGSDFGASGTTLPTSLDGTSVQVNGKAAYVEYISPTQINAITPADTASGSGVNVTVTSSGGTSDISSVTLNSIAPGFFTFSTSEGNKYVAAADSLTNAYIGKVGLFPTAPNLTAPAKPGETITLYGTGFGATSPSIAAGIVTDKVYNLTATPVVMVGGSPAAVGFAGLTPGFAQVYQLNITIPASAPDGDLKIFALANGVSSTNTDACCYVTIKK